MRKLDLLILFAVGVLSSAWCLTSSRELGPTFDEPFYLESGLHFWREGKPGSLLRMGTMPLPAQVQTLPLALWERFTGKAWSLPDDLPTMLTIARAMSQVFWWPLLVYSLLLGRDLGGPWAGRLAVILIGLEPSMLAHAGLATADVAVTACLLALVYHFRRGRELGWGYRVGLPAVLFGLALLAKASTLTFGPLLLLGVELELLARHPDAGRTWWRAFQSLRRDGTIICVLGLVIAVVLAGSDGEPLPAIQKNLRALADDHPLKPTFAVVAELPLWPNAFQTFWFQIKHNLIGHATYLMGYEDPRSLWFYFPVLLTMKLTVGVLMLTALALAGGRLNLGLGLALLLLLFSFNCRVQIGVRLLLPLIAFLLIGVAVRLVAILASLDLRWRAVGIGWLAGLLLWMTSGVVAQWPDGLRYVNELWGGTDSGYRLVSDSNYDWGQGLPELAEWQRQYDVPLAVWYFGTDPRFPHLERYRPASGRSPEKYLAVAVSLLHGNYVQIPQERAFRERLHAIQPVARTRNFLIFDVREPGT